MKKVFEKGWFHYQNLNDRPDGTTGPPTEGRCWLNFNLDESLYFSWCLGRDFCHAGFELGGYEEDVLFKIAFPPVALWFGISNKKLGKLLQDRLSKGEMSNTKNVEISVHDNSIWWEIFTETNYWSNKIPKWKSGNFNIMDFIFGKQEYTNKVIEEKKLDIPMPEGSYPATVKLEVATWDRPRWFAKRVKRVSIDMEKPIPFPGKGENSWDCGDDARHGMTAPAKNMADGIGKMVSSVLNNRLRRGGPYKWEKKNFQEKY